MIYLKCDFQKTPLKKSKIVKKNRKVDFPFCCMKTSVYLKITQKN